MLISFLRTIILYLLLIASIRLMGKRQLGEMEPTEFVVTMLVANLAARAILPRLLPAGLQAWTGLLATLLEIVISVGIILIIIFTNHIGED